MIIWIRGDRLILVCAKKIGSVTSTMAIIIPELLARAMIRSPSTWTVSERAGLTAFLIHLFTLPCGATPQRHLFAALRTSPLTAPWIAYMRIRPFSNHLDPQAIDSRILVSHFSGQYSTMRLLVRVIIILNWGILNWSESHFEVIEICFYESLRCVDYR